MSHKNMSTNMRGYFGIGIYHPKKNVNIGTLWRSACIFGASFMFTIGRRYVKQASDTLCSPRHVPLFNYLSYEEFKENLPYQARLICIEISNEAGTLKEFKHPQQAAYLLGAEDHGLPEKILKGNVIIQIESPRQLCLNVATSGSIIMYDRHIKGLKNSVG